MNDEYKVIKKFDCHGNHMVTVRIGNTAHVMSQEEWKWFLGRLRFEQWKNGVRVRKNKRVS